MGSKGASTPTGPGGLCFELIYHNGTVYKGWICSGFTLMHKDVLVITKGCIGDSEHDLWIGLLD